MLFIDLEKLHIIKDFHPQEIKYVLDKDIVADEDIKMSELKQYIESIIKVDDAKLLKNYATSIDITIAHQGSDDVATEDEAAHFLSVVNTITAIFFNNVLLGGSPSARRKRDYRLDVPDKLKNVKCPRGMLKNAVNNETTMNIFNLTIHYKDLSFVLADEKDLIKQEDFVHSIDEVDFTTKGDDDCVC